ncbi:hypothetical protein V502_08263 [Pseudogymnoascus sp. VKM F-4520 (FW-2644)]|nr:hypothetical protein V502_08263 [Pseudogymnoascus sp. VKM F-4520 (FW-2644)]
MQELEAKKKPITLKTNLGYRKQFLTNSHCAAYHDGRFTTYNLESTEGCFPPIGVKSGTTAAVEMAERPHCHPLRLNDQESGLRIQSLKTVRPEAAAPLGKPPAAAALLENKTPAEP